MASIKSQKDAVTAAISKPPVVAEAKVGGATKPKRAKPASRNATIRLSLAETIHLPYRPTSFKVRDMRRVIADVKRTQG